MGEKSYLRKGREVIFDWLYKVIMLKIKMIEKKLFWYVLKLIL